MVMLGCVGSMTRKCRVGGPPRPKMADGPMLRIARGKKVERLKAARRMHQGRLFPFPFHRQRRRRVKRTQQTTAGVESKLHHNGVG